MAFASSSDSALAVAAQTTFGTATSGSGFQYMRFTGEGLGYNAETTASEEIDATRNVADAVRTAVSAGGSIEFELSRDDVTDLILQSALQSTATFDAGSEAEFNGTTQRLLTIEKKIVGTVPEYFLFDSLAVSSLSVNIEPGSIVTCSAELLGASQAAASASSTISTPTAAGTNSVINAVHGSNQIKLADVDGSGAAYENVQSLNFTIDNGLREQRRIGTTSLGGLGSGRFTVTGSITMYFESNLEYNQFINDYGRELEVILTDGTYGYTFMMPKIKYTSAQVLASGNDSDVVAAFEFQALKHTVGSDTYTMLITRDEAA